MSRPKKVIQLKNIFYLLSVLCLYKGFSQNLIYDNLEQTLKLPTMKCYDIFEDKKHNIWLSSSKGTYKYDGYNFSKIKKNSGKSSTIFHLQEDAENSIYGVNLYGQIMKIDGDSIALFSDLGKYVKGQLPNFKIKDNLIHFFSDNGVYKINENTKKIDTLFNRGLISSFISEKQSYFNIYRSDSLFTIQENSIKKTAPILGEGVFNSIFCKIDNENVFFVYQNKKRENTLVLLNENNYTYLSLPKPLIKLKIYQIKSYDNAVWFCTNNGVLVYELFHKELVYKETYFKQLDIVNILKDYNDNFWFVTLDQGVLVVENLSNKRISFLLKDEKIVASTYLSENSYVVATSKNRLLFYENEKLFKQKRIENCSEIYRLFYDQKNQELIISTKNKTSYSYNVENNTLITFTGIHTIAKSINFVNDSLVFYGNYKEAILYDKNKEIILREKRVITASHLKEMVLISYSDGLYSYDVKNNISKELFYNGKKVFSSKLQSAKNQIYILSQNNEILTYANDKITQVKEINGIKALNIFYQQGLLWILKEDGFVIFNTKTKVIEQITYPKQRLLNNDNIILLQESIVFISPFKIDIIPKKNLFSSAMYKMSPVVIDKFIVNAKKVSLNKNQLASNEKKINFHFTSAGYLAKDKIIYQYKLLPFDKKWQNVEDGLRSVSFKSLPSGRYTFSVRAKNFSRENFSDIVSKEFTIEKPFWKKWWFYLLAVMLLLALIYGVFIKIQTKKEQQQQDLINKLLQEKHIATLKLENLRSQMNPHFIFNALNSIQDYIVSNKQNLASSYLVKFSALIRLYLEYSQQKSITLAQEIEALQFYLVLEKLRFDEELNYEIIVSNTLNTNYRVPSLFIQPYVENAIKHGLLHKIGKKNLMISFEDEANYLKVIIQDNGIGRVKSAIINRENGHQSFATKANNEMVTIYNNIFKKEIKVCINDLYDGEVSKGTEVIIKIQKEV